jgi:CubicO group peptidase (beta-lactamase class C family)
MKNPAVIPFLFFSIFFGCNEKPKATLGDEIIQIENGLSTPYRSSSDSASTYNIYDRMDFYHVPGVSIAVVQNGEIKWAKGYGIADTDTGLEVDPSTLFQAGSISKPVAALGALKLIEQGKLDLDQNVNDYLQGYQVPENEFTSEQKVTVRRLLTHSAGTTVHGFPGYSQTDTFPTVIEVLQGEGNTPLVLVDTIPGSIWRYSGGGYTIMEKVVEDISGQPLEVFLEEQILKPMGMANSTYQQPLGEKWQSNVSAAYNRQGEIIEGKWHNYPEQAAAGLWTTPSELAKYCIEIQNIKAGKADGVLKQETVEAMLSKHLNGWGLGPGLTGEGESLLFRHGGKNAGFSNNMVAFANSGEAVIIMTNADQGVNLMAEILRSISTYYGWGIDEQKVIETIPLPKEHIQEYLGTYLLDQQVPGIGDYFIEVAIIDGKFQVTDPNNGEINILSALTQDNYFDLSSGAEITLEKDGENLKIIFDQQFTFYKQ